MIDKEQYVIIGVAQDIFAAPVARVQEVLEMQNISRLPRAPQNVLGMADVRGQGVPVFDLRLTLGLPQIGNSLDTRIVVLAINGATEPMTIGLRADRVYDVVVLDEDDLDPSPGVGPRITSDCLAGIGRHKGQFVIILNLDRLLGEHPISSAA